MSKSAQSNQAAQARGVRRFVPVSIKPIVVKLTRKLSVTYWPGRRRTVSATLLALLAGFVHSLAAASPTGERVVSGSAVVSRPNASTTLVTQGSQNAIINWQSFSIGAGEGVRFVQPSASAVALNRVVGNDPSRIFGSLSSNGKVFLVNTAGVYFAPGASVDVGGLVASSMRISDANFNAGNYKFEGGAGAGAVDNQGMLRGAFVVLAAPQVSNSGSIVATGGAAALAAGGRVSLDIAGDKLVSLNVDAATANAAVTNSGSISADGGKVFMSAHSANAVLDTVINTSGVVRANSIGMRDGQIVIDGGNTGTVAVSGTLAASGVDAGARGGSVAVLGDRVSLQSGANVDVSGDAGGGSARIGGDFHGAGALKTASQTQVEKGAAINADAITSGNGGTVAVWSDQHTAFAGSISARGGAEGGDGGFVETSGKRTLAYSGAVTTKAAKGAAGTLLLDPTDITISSGASTIAGPGGTFSESGSANSSVLNVVDLTNALNSGNVIVDTTSSGGATGSITVGAPISYGSTNSLTLRADNNISSVGFAISNSAGGAVNLLGEGAITTGSISTAGGNVTIGGASSSMAGSFIGGGIASGGGNVTVQSSGGVSTGAINSGGGKIKVTGNSAVTIDGTLASTNTGADAIVIKAGAQSLAGNGGGGDISISGGGTISVGGSGRATLYTGSLTGSTGVATSVGSGSGHFRYNSAEGTDNFSATLGSGVYAVYREQPTVAISGSSISIIYGTALPVPALLPTGLVNGDTSAQAFSGALVLTPGGSYSSSGQPAVGSHSVTAAGLTDQLGYNIDYAGHTLTVAKKALSMSGLSVPSSKVYDGSTTAVVSGAPTLAPSEAVHSGLVSDGRPYTGDDVTFSGTASGTYDNKNVAGASSVAFGGLSLAGDDGGNYSLTMQPAAAATITPALLTATAAAPNKVYDGTIVAAPTLTITAGLVGTETVSASGSGSFNTKDVATANVVTVNSVALADGANGGLASNYTIASGETAAASITPAILTASVSAPDKVYDATTTAAPLVTVSAGLIGGETVNVSSATGNFNSKDVLTANQVTLNAVTLADGAGGGLASNYSLAPGATGVAHITPKALTANFTAPNKAYDGTTAATPSLTITGGLVGTETVGASGAASFNSKDVLTANTVTLDSAMLADGANGGIGSNYSIATGATTSASITPAALTASVSAPDKVYDATTVAAPVVTVTGGLAAGESLGVVATGSFNSKDVVAANLVSVDSVALADGAGGGLASNYSLPVVGNAVAHITPKALTVSITAPDKIYDATTTATPTLAISAGLLGTETVTASGSASFNSKDVLTAHTVTLDSATLADGANGGLASNYTIASGASTTAHITPAILTASVAAPDKVYDATTGAAPVLTVTGGLVGSETVVVSATGSFNTKDVLTANQVSVDNVTLADGANGGVGSNYSLASGGTTTAHITPAVLTVTLSAPDKAYDGDVTATPVLVVASGLVGVETVNASGAATFNSKDVTTANLVTLDTAALADGSNGGMASNYSLAPGATAPAHITPKALTATVAAPDKVYDGDVTATPTLTIIGGLVGAETVVASGAASFNSKDVISAHTVTVDTATLADGVNGGLASNYSLANGQTVTAHVTPKALAASASTADKVYDGTLDAPTAMLITGGLVGAETLTAATTGSYNSKDVLTAYQVTIDNVTLINGANGGLASNYSLAAPGTPIAAHITPKALSMSGLTATASKVYDGNLAAAVGGIAALDASEAVGTGNATDGKSYSTDVVAIGGTATGTYNSKDVVGANTIAFGGLALSGANQSNYSLTIQAPVAGVVTQRVLGASASAPDKVYDGGMIAAPTLTITSGLVGSETLGVSATGNFNSKDVSTASQVTVDNALLADGTNGGLASNYSLAAGQTAAAHIMAKALTASVVAPDKVYDGSAVAAPTLTITSGLVGAETVNASGAARFNSKDVASANLVTVDSTSLADGANGGLASNYSLAAGQTVTAHVTAKALSAIASAPDKAYDGNVTAAPTLAVSGMVGAETVVASATGSFNSKNVLDANLVTVGGVSLADGANGGLASNYSLGVGQTVTAHITPKALVATASAPDKVYDANVTAAPTLAITAAGLVGAETVTASAIGTFNSKDVVSADHVTVNNVALHDGANGGLASNYSLAAGQTATAHVTRKALTATVTAPDKVYDGVTTAAPTLTVTGGLVGAETVTATGTATFNTKDVPTANLVTVNSTALANGANGGLASNYSLASGQTVAAHISRKSISMSGLSIPASKIYNANTVAVISGTPTLQAAEAAGAGTSTDLKPYVGDSIAISGTPVGTYNSKDVASAVLVSFSGMTLTGAQAGNYLLTPLAARGATITPAHIANVGSINSANKVYDGNTSAAINAGSAVFNGMIAGDGLTIAGGTATFSDRNVASGKTVSISGFTLAGINAPNYILDNNTASTVASITRLPSVTYIGASGGDWATAANWQGGALPDGANVAQVVIPAGKSVNFSSAVAALNGSVKLDGIDGAGTVNVASGTLNVGHSLNIGGYGQSGGAVSAESMAAGSGFNQTGGTLAVTGALGIQQTAGTVSLGNLSAASMSVGGGAGVRQVDGSAVAVRDGITLTTGAGDVVLANANNDFNKVAIGSANNVTLTTKADGLAFGGASVGGDLVATTPGAVTQTGVMAVQGATTIGAGGALHLDDAANSLHGKVKLTSGADASLAATGAVAFGGDIGGALALTTTGAVTQAGDALHVAGASNVNAGSADILLTNTDNDFGAALSASGRNIAVADKSALAFGATTASGTLDATAGGAVTQSGKLTVGGAGSIVAAGQAVTLADSANSFGGTLRLGAASATVNAAAPLGVTSEVTGALTLTAPQLTVGAANALNLHVASTGAATVNADKALSIDGNVSGALLAKAGGAVTQGTAALTVGGTSDIQAAGQSVVLANAGNDFGGDLKLAAASAQLADKNALSFTSAAVTGNLQASAKGDVTQKGALNVGGTTSIDTTGAVTLASATNDFAGAFSASGSNVTLRDANLLTVGKITAPQVDLTAGFGLQMTGSGIIDSPKVNLALMQFSGNGSIGTATLPLKVKDNANVTLGALTPAVPAFFGGNGVQVSVTNGVALREYSRELVALYLGNSKPYNRVLDDFVSQNIVSLSKILRDAQKKADSSTDLIDNGMPIDLTERVAYPHAGTLKLKEPCKDSKDKACK